MSELKTTSLSHKDNNTGTPNITMYPDGTTSLGLTHTGGFKNQIINGDFSIWQRGYDITVPLSGATDGAAYTADRWIAGQGNVRVRAATPSASLPDFGWSLLFDGQREHDYIAQPVELTRPGRLEPFFPGTTWTFSIYHNGNPDDFGFRAYFGDGGLSSTTVDEVVPFGTVLTNLGNSRYSHTFTIPSNQVINGAATNFRVELYSKTGAVVTGVRMTGCQLEPGPVATAFEIRPASVELSMCHRYYYRINCGGGMQISTGMSTSTTANVYVFSLPSPLRVPPTYIHSGNSNFLVYRGNNSGTGVTSQDAYLPSAGNSQMRLTAVTSGTSTPGDVSQFYGNSGAWIAFDAEL